ncbi:uncharacterized protein BP5553_06257 [Venustampulla echinocandica]|uniref:Uncharacterized protein n=1 Tax=Venustampulla echinocandica TaxID=2656787 RepID=A0A370TN13_9HELO|nr:uncharacterized protein BP5553_06257 [Venustampulla echinocandica]RDL36905.1 hypothetical protein BP5553_06257 [Venustampulla echinocandica]
MDTLYWDTFLSNPIDDDEAHVHGNPDENLDTSSNESSIPCRNCRHLDRLCKRCRQKLKKASLELACSPSNFGKSTAVPLRSLARITVPIRQMTHSYTATCKDWAGGRDGITEPYSESSGGPDTPAHIELKDTLEPAPEDENENEHENEEKEVADAFPIYLPVLDPPTPRYMPATILRPQQQPCLHFVSGQGQSRVVFRRPYTRGTGSVLGVFATPEVGEPAWHRIWSWWAATEWDRWTDTFRFWKARNQLNDVD